MLWRAHRKSKFLPPYDLSKEIAVALLLLRTSVNMTLSTVNRDGTPRGTTLTAVFRPTDEGIIAEWYSERLAPHSDNIRRRRFWRPRTTGQVALTLYDSLQRMGALNLHGRARTVPVARMEPRAAQAVLDAHNARRLAKDPCLCERTLDEFTRPDNPMELWEVPIEFATAPATCTSADGRTRMGRAPIPLPALIKFEVDAARCITKNMNVADEYDRIAGMLASAGAVKSQMFGKPTLKIGKKAFASLFDGDMVFKLPPEAYEQALALPGATPFTPGGHRMTGWARISPASQHEWLRLAQTACAYVVSLTQ